MQGLAKIQCRIQKCIKKNQKPIFMVVTAKRVLLSMEQGLLNSVYVRFNRERMVRVRNAYLNSIAGIARTIRVHVKPDLIYSFSTV